MEGSYVFPIIDSVPSRSVPVVTRRLILINVVVFFVELALSQETLCGLLPVRYRACALCTPALGGAGGFSYCPDRVTRVSGDASDVFRLSFVRSFRGSVYTGRMSAQPPVRVMKKEPDVYEVEVTAARPTLHCVTAGADDVECLTGGKANAERLIEESFRFLLERESNTSILRSFRITDISRYFPEYEREIRRRLAG